MAIALVKLGTAQSGTGTVSPTFGQATGSGNLLIAWVVHVAGLSAVSGWTEVLSASIGTVSVFYKANSSASEAAPTFSDGGSGLLITACLGEFSGADTSTPKDKNGDNFGTASPVVATASATDTSSGDLTCGVSRFNYTMAATKTTSHAYNNGATAQAVSDNDATSTADHYRFSYGITTGNASADTLTHTFTTTAISQTEAEIVSFRVPGAAASAPPYLNMARSGPF